MTTVAAKADTAWRKSRLAARLLLRKESRPLRPHEQALARRLSQDAEVTDRLIQQALYFLGIGPRKHDFDQKLVGVTCLAVCANRRSKVSETKTRAEARAFEFL